MKMLLPALTVAVLWGLGSEPPAPARQPAGLEGSKHDFSAATWSGGDLCVACHFQDDAEAVPHAPLWNPAADFDRTFADALRADRGPAMAEDALRQSPHRYSPLRQLHGWEADRGRQPGPGTLTCLMCHDGTMASDMFGGLGGAGPARERHPALSSSAHGGSNHPVGVEYPLFDSGYRPMQLILAEGQVPLPDGRVECVSCHDPHNELGRPFMLTKSNVGSALCLTCHKK